MAEQPDDLPDGTGRPRATRLLPALLIVAILVLIVVALVSRH